MSLLTAPAAKPTTAVAAGSGTAATAAQAPQGLSFMRSTRAQSTFAATIVAPAALGAAQIPLPLQQIRPQGFLRALRLIVTATTAGNAATVAFNADAPWNLLQNVILSSPGSDVYLGPLDGFALYVVHKYGAMASSLRDPLTYPSNTKVAGAGATGGSFQFELDIPVEIDSRNAFGVLQNQNGAELFNLQMTLNTAASLYATAPTVLPTVTINVVMDYYSQPAASNGKVAQATAPIGNGSYSLIQSQTINPIAASSTGRQQIINTGTILRGVAIIYRTPAGVRTEVDIPNLTNLYLGGQQLLYKLYALWRNQQNEEYKLIGAPVATPASLSPDNGVMVFTDWMNSGSGGDRAVDGSSNRSQWLPTGRGTFLEIEATQPYGAGIGSIQIITFGVKPTDGSSLYAAHLE
jgi:hypothetical protein